MCYTGRMACLNSRHIDEEKSRWSRGVIRGTVTCICLERATCYKSAPLCATRRTYGVIGRIEKSECEDKRCTKKFQGPKNPVPYPQKLAKGSTLCQFNPVPTHKTHSLMSTSCSDSRSPKDFVTFRFSRRNVAGIHISKLYVCYMPGQSQSLQWINPRSVGWMVELIMLLI
jgi:hypothetical protein